MARLDIPADTPEEKKKEILKYAADFYKSEIDNFWKRSIFFWGFIAAAFLAYGTVFEKNNDAAQLISCFGFVCSVAWTLLNRGGKYWYEAWEQKVAAAQIGALGVPLFTNVEDVIPNCWWGAARFSCSRLTIALSDFVVLTWLALGARTLSLDGLISPLGRALIFVGGSLIFAVVMAFACKSSQKNKF
jgi:hypothetical protein